MRKLLRRRTMLAAATALVVFVSVAQAKGPRYDDPKKADAVEVYDHVEDPDENVNMAVDPANEELVKQLTEQYLKGWRGALPK